MPWSTPTLRDVRSLVRDSIRGNLPGADASIPNSVLRVLSDNQGALCHLVLQYVDWLALQLLPDTAETEWLDRHGKIWLVNADGTTGRKVPTQAEGTVAFTATADGIVIPVATQVSSSGVDIIYETTEIAYSSIVAPVNVAVRAINPGAAGNLIPGTPLNLATPITGITGANVIYLTGGTDEETDDQLRERVLLRIRNPPMGGDANDYVQWALAVPGVTRAWCFPQEMGIGTCTVRFMMDDLRVAGGGFPLPDDVEQVAAYLNTVRPVTVKDLFVEAPIPYPVGVRISWLDVDDRATHSAIETRLLQEFYTRQLPGQTWYRAWTDRGIMEAPGVNAYDLIASDVPMPSNGYMPVLGDITYG